MKNLKHLALLLSFAAAATAIPTHAADEYDDDSQQDEPTVENQDSSCTPNSAVIGAIAAFSGGFLLWAGLAITSMVRGNGVLASLNIFSHPRHATFKLMAKIRDAKDDALTALKTKYPHLSEMASLAEVQAELDKIPSCKKKEDPKPDSGK